MRDVINGKLKVPDFSERLADYEADRAAFFDIKDEYDGIRYQTAYVNKLGKLNELILNISHDSQLSCLDWRTKS